MEFMKRNKLGIFLCKPTYIRGKTNFFKEMFYYSKFVHMYGKENEIHFPNRNKLFLGFILGGVIYQCQHMKQNLSIRRLNRYVCA